MGNRNFIPGVTEPKRSCRITSLAMALHALGVSAHNLINTTNPKNNYYVNLKKLMNVGNWLAEDNCRKSGFKIYNSIDDLLNERFPDFLQLLFIYAVYDGKIPNNKDGILKKRKEDKLSLKNDFRLQPPIQSPKKTSPAKETLVEKLCKYFGVNFEGRKKDGQNPKTIKQEIDQGKEILLGWWTENCSLHTVYLVGFDEKSKFIINDPGIWRENMLRKVYIRILHNIYISYVNNI